MITTNNAWKNVFSPTPETKMLGIHKKFISGGKVMKQAKTDRRVKYTVSMLKAALVQSMQKEHISKISVKSLCDLADVNRSTFYAHFYGPVRSASSH